jgi:hypothetical protein
VSQSALTGPSATETTTPTEDVLLQGTLSVPQGSFADLKAGLVSPGWDPSADIWFEVETDTLRFLVAVNDVTLARVGTSPPGKAGCANRALSLGGINVDQLAVGTYVCVRTTSGRFSQVRVADGPGPTPGVLTIDFITYR